MKCFLSTLILALASSTLFAQAPAQSAPASPTNPPAQPAPAPASNLPVVNLQPALVGQPAASQQVVVDASQLQALLNQLETLKKASANPVQISPVAAPVVPVQAPIVPVVLATPPYIWEKYETYKWDYYYDHCGYKVWYKKYYSDYRKVYPGYGYTGSY
jgi:hypothetical protein